MLADVSTGEEIAVCSFDYPHGVMDTQLPTGEKLGVDWALQHPQDYLDAIYKVIPGVIKASGADSDDIIGVGVDFTACTVMPVTKDGTPLCFIE